MAQSAAASMATVGAGDVCAGAGAKRKKSKAKKKKVPLRAISALAKPAATTAAVVATASDEHEAGEPATKRRKTNPPAAASGVPSASAASSSSSGAALTGAALIGEFHRLQKRRAQVLADQRLKPAARDPELARIDAALEALGGLDAYQKWSLRGEKRGKVTRTGGTAASALGGAAAAPLFTSAHFVAKLLLQFEASNAAATAPPTAAPTAGTATGTADGDGDDDGDAKALTDGDSDADTTPASTAPTASASAAAAAKRRKKTGPLHSGAARALRGGFRYRVMDVGGNANPFLCEHVKRAFDAPATPSAAATAKVKPAAAPATPSLPDALSVGATSAARKWVSSHVSALPASCKCSAHYGGWLCDVLPIDLHPQHRSVAECDFFAFPHTAFAGHFDALVCSLVINFVGDKQLRGDMLVRAHHMLATQRRTPTPTGSGTGSSGGGLLFVILPLACVSNSRYLTADTFVAAVSAIGFECVHQKLSKKLAFFVFARDDARAAPRPFTFKPDVIRGGAARNNFSLHIVIPE